MVTAQDIENWLQLASEREAADEVLKAYHSSLKHIRGALLWMQERQLFIVDNTRAVPRLIETLDTAIAFGEANNG